MLCGHSRAEPAIVRGGFMYAERSASLDAFRIALKECDLSQEEHRVRAINCHLFIASIYFDTARCTGPRSERRACLQNSVEAAYEAKSLCGSIKSGTSSHWDLHATLLLAEALSKLGQHKKVVYLLRRFHTTAKGSELFPYCQLLLALSSAPQRGFEICRQVQESKAGSINLNAATWFTYGKVARQAQEYEKALEALSMALPLYAQLDDLVSEAEVYGEMADLYESLGKLSSALSFAEHKHTLAVEGRSEFLQYTTMSQRARILTALNRQKEAVELWSQVHKAAQEYEDYEVECATSKSLIKIQEESGAYTDVLKTATALTSLAQRSGATDVKVFGLHRMAAAHLKLGHYERCLQALEKLEEVLDQVGETIDKDIHSDAKQLRALALSGLSDATAATDVLIPSYDKAVAAADWAEAAKLALSLCEMRSSPKDAGATNFAKKAVDAVENSLSAGDIDPQATELAKLGYDATCRYVSRAIQDGCVGPCALMPYVERALLFAQDKAFERIPLATHLAAANVSLADSKCTYIFYLFAEEKKDMRGGSVCFNCFVRPSGWGAIGIHHRTSFIQRRKLFPSLGKPAEEQTGNSSRGRSGSSDAEGTSNGSGGNGSSTPRVRSSTPAPVRKSSGSTTPRATPSTPRPSPKDTSNGGGRTTERESNTSGAGMQDEGEFFARQRSLYDDFIRPVWDVIAHAQHVGRPSFNESSRPLVVIADPLLSSIPFGAFLSADGHRSVVQSVPVCVAPSLSHLAHHRQAQKHSHFAAKSECWKTIRSVTRREFVSELEVPSPITAVVCDPSTVSGSFSVVNGSVSFDEVLSAAEQPQKVMMVVTQHPSFVPSFGKEGMVPQLLAQGWPRVLRIDCVRFTSQHERMLMLFRSVIRDFAEGGFYDNMFAAALQTAVVHAKREGIPTQVWASFTLCGSP